MAWKVNDTTTYLIENMKPSFFYLDSRQKAEITGNDTIIIDGGRVESVLNFTWRKTTSGSSINGTGIAMGISDEITFAKRLKVVDNYLTEVVADYWNVTFGENAFRIGRIEPPSTSQEDHDRLTRLINDVLNVTTARHELED